MQCCLKSAKLYSIAVLLMVCCLFAASCGSSSSSLTNAEILATADAIRAQTPAPTDRPSAELKVIEQENQDTENTETLNEDIAQTLNEDAATANAESVYYDDYRSTEMAADYEVYLENADAEGTPIPSTDPSAIQWNETGAHVGRSMLVCGPVAGTRYASTTKGSPTFINLGADYPNSQRFTIVIWGSNRANFDSAPETYYLGKTLCVDGLIESFRNIIQVQVSRPMQIEIK